MKKAPVTPTEIPITDPIDVLDDDDWTLIGEVSSAETGVEEESFTGYNNAVTGGGGDVSTGRGFGNGGVNIVRGGGGCKATLSSIGSIIGFNDAFPDDGDGEGGSGECVKLMTVGGGLGMAFEVKSFPASDDGDGECGGIGVMEWKWEMHGEEGDYEVIN